MSDNKKWYDYDVPPEQAAKMMHQQGLLGEINRRVLHPLGMALSVTHDGQGNITGFGPLYISNDPGGIIFSEEALAGLQDKWERFFTPQTRAEGTRQRIQKHGFDVQPFPSQHPIPLAEEDAEEDAEELIQTCPYRMNQQGPWEYREGLDRWVKKGPDLVCNFCGSMHPSGFFNILEQCLDDPNIRVSLGKPGKIYIHRDGIKNANDGAIKFKSAHVPEGAAEKFEKAFKAAHAVSQERFKGVCKSWVERNVGSGDQGLQDLIDSGLVVPGKMLQESVQSPGLVPEGPGPIELQDTMQAVIFEEGEEDDG